MEDTKKDIYKLIILGTLIVLLIIFIIVCENINKNDKSNSISNNTYSDKNSIDENNLQQILGYNNLYYYEIDLETY